MPARLADLTTLRLGGPAAELVTAHSREELIDAVRAAGQRMLLVGGGSNLVVGDAGFDATVVLVRTRGLTVDGNRVRVQAGEPWDSVVAATIELGLSGLAAMSGIPGLTGATPVQNVGAYGREVAEVITSLDVLDRASGAVETWDAARCAFGFRTSAFKHTDRYVVLSVDFALERSTDAPPARYLELARRLGIEPGERAPSTEVRAVVLDLRRSKGMLLDAADHDTWSVGSFFVNPFVDPDQVPDGCPNWAQDGRVKLSAAWLIENAGFGKGFAVGPHASVSTKHTLALTNRGDATTEDLLALARVIRDGVEARFGIRLRPEAHLVGAEL